jgi:N-acetylmuramoyl-L-alanine amidase
MIYDEQDVTTMALCVWKEARGEGQDGMAAVAHVILNRARRWYATTRDPIHNAVYAKNQFTSMSVSSDPEFNLQPQPNDLQYEYCLFFCKGLLSIENEAGVSGFAPDRTNGALYYADLKNVTSGWFFEHIVKAKQEHPLTATIGKHSFYA